MTVKECCFYFGLVTIDLATNARNCYNGAYNVASKLIQANPDKEILGWLNAEV